MHKQTLRRPEIPSNLGGLVNPSSGPEIARSKQRRLCDPERATRAETSSKRERTLCV